MSRPTGDVIWQDGTFVPWGMATVHVLAHSLNYGSAVFEGIRAYVTDRGVSVFRLHDHLDRLVRSGDSVYLPIPFGPDELAHAVLGTVSRNRLGDCYIRVLAFIADTQTAVDFDEPSPSVCVSAWPVRRTAPTPSVRVRLSPWRRLPAASVPLGAKASGLYLNSRLAKLEARRAGFDEALLLSSAGDVAEGATENVFAVIGGRLTTPPAAAGLLPGITRNSIIALAADRGIAVDERPMHPHELAGASEVFLTGTAAEIAPVSGVDAVALHAPGPVTSLVQAAYAAATTGADPAHRDWCTDAPVDAVDEVVMVPNRTGGERR